MVRANLRILTLTASISLLAALPLEAAPPSLVPGPGTQPGPQAPASKPIQEYQGLGVDRQLTQFAGIVLDVSDRPLNDVQVTLCVDGRLVASSTTANGGYYEIKVPYDLHSDTTTLLWYVPPDKTLMPKEVVLRESKVSRENALISRCVPRATITPGRQFRVYLFDAANRNKDIAETSCLP
ncbi:MAG: hypothetical protein HY568_02960 [Candidatus Latescibacteria bacterium]|nr:hypothetical protein [Candidatus Latescibacterota bacterium]